jgi:choline dehydrogenase
LGHTGEFGGQVIHFNRARVIGGCSAHNAGGDDRARLAEGVERVREAAQGPELRRLLGRERRPGPDVSGRQAIERFLDHAAVHYYHPAGSCKMGPASDPDSVVDSEGRVHGIEGLYVADASLMPAVTSGNTNMPTAVIGERIARSLLEPPASYGHKP